MVATQAAVADEVFHRVVGDVVGGDATFAYEPGEGADGAAVVGSSTVAAHLVEFVDFVVGIGEEITLVVARLVALDDVGTGVFAPLYEGLFGVAKFVLHIYKVVVDFADRCEVRLAAAGGYGPFGARVEVGGLEAVWGVDFALYPVVYHLYDERVQPVFTQSRTIESGFDGCHFSFCFKSKYFVFCKSKTTIRAPRLTGG